MTVPEHRTDANQCSSPPIEPCLEIIVIRDIMILALQGMAIEVNLFCNVLYAGFIVFLSVAKLFEFNARFGDPETQAIMPLIESDLSEILMATAVGHIEGKCLTISLKSSVSIVMSAEGYPGPFRRNDTIPGIEKASVRPHTGIFKAG
jgi:phosphoribosylamine--glycine ligase